MGSKNLTTDPAALAIASLRWNLGLIGGNSKQRRFARRHPVSL